MANEDTDIVSVPEFVLVEIATLKKSIEGLNDLVNARLNALAADFSSIRDLLKQVNSLQERQEHHGTGLERAFGEMEKLEDYTRKEFQDVSADLRSHETETFIIEKKLKTWHGLVMGIALTTSAFVGFIAWVGSDYLQQARMEIENARKRSVRLNDRVHALELYVSRKHGEKSDE